MYREQQAKNGQFIIKFEKGYICPIGAQLTALLIQWNVVLKIFLYLGLCYESLKVSQISVTSNSKNLSLEWRLNVLVCFLFGKLCHVIFVFDLDYLID